MKTPGAAWLEEVIDLVESSGEGPKIAEGLYSKALDDAFCAIYDLPEDVLRFVYDLNMMGDDHPRPLVGPADGRAGRGRHPERLFDECRPAAEARRRLLGLRRA